MATASLAQFHLTTQKVVWRRRRRRALGSGDNGSTQSSSSFTWQQRRDALSDQSAQVGMKP